MQKSKEKYYKQIFSHIYVEKKVLDYDEFKEIKNKFKNSVFVEIDNYKDVFSKKNQNFVIQKQSPKLIIARKKDNFIYEGANVCQSFGYENFYYTSSMMNCVYDCEYCYLQGMYNSANIVLFINIEDYFREIEKVLNTKSVYLCISYDTDMLAFESIFNYSEKWMNFVSRHENLLIELRTKSANTKFIDEVVIPENIILAWTLSPKEVIEKYENKTPSLERRIDSIKKAIKKNCKVRICIDPIVYIENWKEKYKNLIEKIFYEVNGDDILDVSIGVFRISKTYLKTMRKHRKESAVLQYPYVVNNEVASYDENLKNEMIKYVTEILTKYISKEKIYY